MTLAPRVVKLGGSLLGLPDLAARLRHWLNRAPPRNNVIVAGGGRLADVIRDYDQRHALGETASHWLCIRAMSINAELVAALVPEAAMIASVGELRTRASSTGCSIIDPWSFVRHEEPRLLGEPLPASWRVTSDSVAARLAEIVGGELVLLKSKLPPAGATLAAAAAAGYVDGFFPIAAGKLSRIECVNLREESFAAVRLV